MAKSFTFILTPLDYTGDYPLEIIPGHFFQKADREQRETIKDNLAVFLPMQSHFPNSYEFDFAPQLQTGPQPARQLTQMPEKDWRYWIIAFDGGGLELTHLEFAASLMKHDLTFGLTCTGSRGDVLACAIDVPSLLTYFVNAEPRSFYVDPVPISQEDLSQLENTYSSSKNLDRTKFDAIHRAFELFKSTKALYTQSQMHVLALFAVIECLATHMPDPKDPTDSLSRQVRAKLPLLRKLFARPFDYGSYFENTPEDKVWERLYLLRNHIAHGVPTDFANKFSPLKNHDSVVRFLRETVKLLLLLALKEPVLLTDLKRC